ELIGADRLGHGGGIEPGTLIGDRDADAVGEELGPYVHPLSPLLAVSAHDGIAQRLREHHLETEAGLLEGTMSGETMAGDQLNRLLDALDLARQAKGDEGRGLSRVRGRRAADTESKRGRHRETGLKACEGLLGRFGDGEECVELGQLEER